MMRWREKRLSASSLMVPESPGVYAIGYQEMYHDLELRRVYVYIGETNNLKRRLGEHLPETEQNQDLRVYLRRNYESLICWYVPTEIDQTKSVQDDLIRRIQPRFNTVGLKGHSGKDPCQAK